MALTIGEAPRKVAVGNAGGITAEPERRLMMVRAEVVDEETRLFWSTRVGKDVSEEDVREISENLVGFVTVLHAWESSKKMKAAEEQRSPGNGCKDSFTSMGKMVLQ